MAADVFPNRGLFVVAALGALDLRTLFVVCSAVLTGLALALVFVWRETPDAEGLGRFPLGLGCLGAAAVLVALQGSIPEPVSILGANAAATFGVAVLLEGTRLFYGLPVRRMVTTLAVATVLAASIYNVYVEENDRARIVVVSAVLAALAGWEAWIMFSRGRRAKEGLAALLTSLALASFAGVLALRALVSAAGPRVVNLMAGHWVTALMLLVAMLGMMGRTVGVVVITNHRLTASIQEAHQRVAESEERYRRVVETSPDLIYRVDELGYFSYVSPAAARMMGYALEDVQGRRFLEFIRPDFRKPAADLYARQALEGIATTYFEFPALAKDGREVWIGQNVQLLAEGERVVGFEAVARDINERKRAEAELRSQKQLFENLVAVARATTEGRSLEATLENTLEVASSLTGATGASLFLLSEKGTVTHGIYTRGPAALVVDPPGAERLMREGLAGWTARQREAAIVQDTLHDPRWFRLSPRDFPSRSALVIPISSGPSLVGVLSLVHADPGHFTEDHRNLMEASAAQIALSLRNAQVSEARLRLAGKQSLLYEVLNASSRHLDPDEIAKDAAEAIAKRTGWIDVVVAVPGEEGRFRLHGISAGLPEVPASVSGGVLGRAFSTGRTQLVPDVSADPDYVAGPPNTRSELAAPLLYQDRVLGVLNLESPAAAAFGPEEVRLAESLAEAIALGLENARLYRTVAAQSARLEAVVRSNRDGLVLLGEDGLLLLVSDPALSLLGLPGRPEDWFGRPLESLIQRLERSASEGVASVRWALERPGDGTHEGECIVPPRALRWSTAPVPSVGRLFVFRDVTREREVEQMREDLSRTMVHDLRNPLTAILGALELVGASESFTAQQRQMLTLAEENAYRQLHLINSILEVSRLEQGAAPLQRSRFDAATVVAEVLRLSGPQATAEGIALLNEVPRGLPQVWADRGLVRRVLENLVGNAIKFTAPGGLVRVRAEQADSEDLRVSVLDNGAGVPEVIRPRLFQKFAAGGQKERGSGLGLAFCRVVVEAHGGRIWLETEPGPGAGFVFTLPLAAVD